MVYRRQVALLLVGYSKWFIEGRVLAIRGVKKGLYISLNRLRGKSSYPTRFGRVF